MWKQNLQNLAINWFHRKRGYHENVYEGGREKSKIVELLRV